MPTASQDLLGEIRQFVGTTTNDYMNGYFYKCVEGSTTGTYEWEAVNVQAGGSQVQADWNQSNSSAVDYIKNKPDLSTKQDVIQVTTMPTASQDLEGKVLQYVGANVSNSYQKGWFYICGFDPFSGEYEWISIIVDKVDNYGSPVTSRAVYAVTSALQKKITRSTQITIPTSAWNSTTKQCTIQISPTVYDLGRSVIDIETGENSTWDDCGVYMLSYTGGNYLSGSLPPITAVTFECDEVPDEALHFYITSMEVN
jgi:hypothetical protein